MSRTFALFSSITTSRRPGPGARVCRWYLYIFYLIYDLYRGLYRDRYSKSSEIAGSRAGAPGQGGRVMHFEMFGASVLVGMMAGWPAGIVMKGGGYGLLWEDPLKRRVEAGWGDGRPLGWGAWRVGRASEPLLEVPRVGVRSQ